MASRLASLASLQPHHVIIIPYPLQGHINPLIQLAKVLASRGFVITFVNAESNNRRMLQARQEQKIVDTGLDIRLVGLPADGLISSSHDFYTQVVDFFSAVERIGDEFDKFVENLVQKEVHITCIIADSFLLWTRQIANKWNIPRVLFFPNSMSVFSCSFHVPEIMGSGLDPFRGEAVSIGDAADPLTCIPGLSPFPPAALPFKTLCGELTAQWLYSQITEQFTHLEQALCFVVNSFHELEIRACEHLQLSQPRTFLLGPLLPSVFLAEGERQLDSAVGASLNDEDECMEWLDTQGPLSVLYISLGSLAIMSGPEIEEMAKGLARSKQPFLWVHRADSKDEASKAIAKAWPDGWASLESQGKIISWAAQLRVLSHKAVGGFLTHCGWNSTLESISMGVPMIGWPKMMDQITNCWFVVNEWKVGVKLESGDRQEVERAVRLVMQEQEGHEMRARVSQLRMTARAAFQGTSHEALESFINCILEEARSVQSCDKD